MIAKRKELTTEEIDNCRNLIKTLIKINEEFYSLGCTILRNYITLIPDELYKIGIGMIEDGFSPQIIEFSLRSNIIKSDLKGLAYVRAEIIKDSLVYLYLHSSLKIKNVILYANLPIEHIINDFPDLCAPYDNAFIITKFLEITKHYSLFTDIYNNFKLQNLFESKLADSRDLYFNKLFIDILGAKKAAVSICALNETIKSKILSATPLPFINSMVEDLVSLNLTKESIRECVDLLYNVLQGEYPDKAFASHELTQNLAPIAYTFIAKTKPIHLPKLQSFANKLLDAYPHYPYGYKVITEYISSSNKPLYFIAYEFFLSGIDTSIAFEVIMKYIDNFEYQSLYDSLEDFLLAIFLLSIRQGLGSTEQMFKSILCQ